MDHNGICSAVHHVTTHKKPHAHLITAKFSNRPTERPHQAFQGPSQHALLDLQLFSSGVSWCGGEHRSNAIRREVATVSGLSQLCSIASMQQAPIARCIGHKLAQHAPVAADVGTSRVQRPAGVCQPKVRYLVLLCIIPIFERLRPLGCSGVEV